MSDVMGVLLISVKNCSVRLTTAADERMVYNLDKMNIISSWRAAKRETNTRFII